MEILLGLILATAVLILVCVAMMSLDLRAIRRAAGSGGVQPHGTGPGGVRPVRFTGQAKHAHMQPVGKGMGFFVIWDWYDGRWHLSPTSCPSGANPGLPPAYAGAFEGDHVKCWVEETG